MDRRNRAVPLWSLYGSLVLLAGLALLLGRYPIGIGDFLDLAKGALDGMERDRILGILINIRLPRILAAVLVGSALSVAGAGYQGVFKNPMVSPSVLGVSAGAGFGAAAAILLKLPAGGVQIMAFGFGVAAVLIVVAVGNRVTRSQNPTLSLVLLGMVISSLFSALLSLLKYVGDPQNDLPAITFWLMGSLSGVSLAEIGWITGPVIAGIAGLWAVKWRLNMLTLSDEEALSMGVPVKGIRMFVILCATLMTAAVVSVSGIIGWVGLVIPHLMRMVVGNDLRRVIPASAAAGALFLLVVDVAARTLFAAEVPLGILTSMAGTPVFVSLLLRGRKHP